MMNLVAPVLSAGLWWQPTPGYSIRDHSASQRSVHRSGARSGPWEQEGRHAMPIVQSRRHLLTNIALAGATGVAGLSAAGLYGGRKSVAAEPPPEVTTIRFEKDGATCIAPQVFQELLHAEGFTDIQYVDATESHLRRADAAKSDFVADMIAHGEIDFGRQFAPALILGMNAGAPLTVLSGLHLGCFEVFGKEEIRTLGDL